MTGCLQIVSNPKSTLWQLWKALNREEASCPSRQLQITVVWPSWSNPWQLKSVPKLLESKVTVCRAAIISPHLLTICHYLSSAVLLCLCWLWLATFLGQLHQSEAHTRHTQTDGLHTPHATENNEHTQKHKHKHMSYKEWYITTKRNVHIQKLLKLYTQMPGSLYVMLKAPEKHIEVAHI